MTTPSAKNLFESYDRMGFFCEMFGAGPRPPFHTELVRRRLEALGLSELRARAGAAERELYNLGITFAVVSETESLDRILPFDIIPRLLSPEDWRTIETGLVQRVRALNLFIHDIYHDQKILKDGVVPADLVLGNPGYRPEMRGVDLAFGTYIHICGIDIVRDEIGRFLVLEDNARTPSGVSYVVENRLLMQRTFSDLLVNIGVRPVTEYGPRLHAALCKVAPRTADPHIVLLSPGVYNSAYFEHVFLAREMGVPLVEGPDLMVEDDRVYMKTATGLAPVDVIYRRVNDDYLDPDVFQADSVVGVAGLMRAYRRGNVALANAIGTGVADDKAVYYYVPRIIRYYLGEDPILPNVETYLCREKRDLAFTLDHLADLVVKPVGESGGYGVVVGPRATVAEIAECRAKILARPESFISQPMINI